MSAEFIEVGQTLDRNLFPNSKETHYPFFYLLENGNKFFHIDQKSGAISENLVSWVFFFSGIRNYLRFSLTFIIPVDQKQIKTKQQKQFLSPSEWSHIEWLCRNMHQPLCNVHTQKCNWFIFEKFIIGHSLPSV